MAEVFKLSHDRLHEARDAALGCDQGDFDQIDVRGEYILRRQAIDKLYARKAEPFRIVLHNDNEALAGWAKAMRHIGVSKVFEVGDGIKSTVDSSQDFFFG